VNVEIVDFDKSEGEVIPPTVRTVLYGIKKGLENYNTFSKKLDWFVNTPKIYPTIVLNDQEYNEEDGNAPTFSRAKEWEAKIGVELKSYKFTIIGPKFLPNIVTKYVNLELYGIVSLDFEAIMSEKKTSLLGTAPYKDKKRKYVGQIVGGAGIGLNGVTKLGFFNLEVDAKGKSEIEGSLGLRNGKLGSEATWKPLIFTFEGAAKIPETLVTPEIVLFQLNYVKNLTNEEPIWNTWDD
jgi:hypothetical protein